MFQNENIIDIMIVIRIRTVQMTCLNIFSPANMLNNILVAGNILKHTIQVKKCGLKFQTMQNI